MTIEKAMQLIKGSFSYRARTELGFKTEIWQPGFTDRQGRDQQSSGRISCTSTTTP